MVGPAAARVIHSEALAYLRTVPAETYDMVVTDPPCGIKFMGLKFDHDRGGRENWIAWLGEILAEALRVTKPGALAAFWAIPRTLHWTMAAVRAAGFEVADIWVHVNGTGVPKGRNISKNVPAAEAEKWAGYNTTLKPACEFWVVARAPEPGLQRRLWFGRKPQFFYVAKASGKDRGGKLNDHPTVKSTALMRAILRTLRDLSPVPVRKVLDPFLGSGTTAVAALAEGLSCTGCEAEAQFVKIAQARTGARYEVKAGTNRHWHAWPAPAPAESWPVRL